MSLSQRYELPSIALIQCLCIGMHTQLMFSLDLLGVLAFDALGLGVFATTGTTIAMDAGLPFASAILLGVLTAVGGGMIRDVLANKIPAVFNGSDLYVIPAVVGAGLTALLWALGWFESWVALVIAVLVCAVRMLAWHSEWRIPSPMRDDHRVRSTI